MKFRAGPIVMAVAVLGGCGSTTVTRPAVATVEPRIEPSASAAPIEATPAPAATATPSVADDVVRLTWSEVPFDGRVAAMVGDGSRFVAVGSGTDGVASWISTDGTEWEQQDVPEVSFGEVDEGVELTPAMGQLIRLGDTLYSFGGSFFMDAWLPAAWRWTDGGTWAVIESESEFFRGSVTSVTASDEALLAVTVSYYEGLRGTASTWLWTAADSWVKTGLSSSADEDIRVQDVAWSDGAYVAVGDVALRQDGAGPDAWPRAPSIWRSANGRDWTATQPHRDASSVCSVTALPTGGFVALGTTGERAASWTSIDGDDWVDGTMGLPTGPGVRAVDQDATPCNVVPFDGGLLAAATTEGATLTWTSRDGRSWSFDQRLDVASGGQATVASTGGHVLVVGYRVAGDAGGSRQVLLLGSARP